MKFDLKPCALFSSLALSVALIGCAEEPKPVDTTTIPPAVSSPTDPGTTIPPATPADPAATTPTPTPAPPVETPAPPAETPKAEPPKAEEPKSEDEKKAEETPKP